MQNGSIGRLMSYRHYFFYFLSAITNTLIDHEWISPRSSTPRVTHRRDDLVPHDSSHESRLISPRIELWRLSFLRNCPTNHSGTIYRIAFIYIYRSQYSGVKRIYCSSRIENGFDFVLLQLVQKCFLLTNAPTRVVTRYVRDLAISDFWKRCFLWSTLLLLGTEFSSMFYES